MSKKSKSDRPRSLIRSDGWLSANIEYNELKWFISDGDTYTVRHLAIADWCRKTLKSEDYKFSRTIEGHRRILFKNECDKMLFLLKWEE